MKRIISLLCALLLLPLVLAGCTRASTEDGETTAANSVEPATAAVSTAEPNTTAASTTAEPITTATPGTTAEPETTATPGTTAEPETTAGPVTTAVSTAEPVTSAEPETTAEPVTTAEPETTVEPETTAEPITTDAPTTAEEPLIDENAYAPVPYDASPDKYSTRIFQKRDQTSGASIVSMPSREGVVYARRLPISCDLYYAANRDELIEIVNFHAFYRESGFSVTLGYEATDVEEELDFLWRNSGLLPSQCSLFGSLENGVITVDLKFYQEKYLAIPRYTTPARYISVETDPPTGVDTLPGLDPENGISVWDSEQACYALAHGYTIAPIPGSPAETAVNRAIEILSGLVDDSMTKWQIAYRVYVWLMDNAVYDQGEHWAGQIDADDRAKESEALSARLISFKAEGPLFYGVGACFGFAKASVLMLGLEGIELRRVVAFSTRLPGGRCCIIANSTSIAIHSYLYLRIDGYDYIYDPTFVGENKLKVSGVDISVYREFCIGLSFVMHRKTFGSVYPKNDFFSETDEYRPGMYNYLTELTYDGTHDLLLSSKEEAQDYYDYLLETVFSQPAEYRTVAFFYDNVSYSTWKSKYRSQLESFLNATGVPYRYAEEDSTSRGIANVTVKVVFGK